MKFAIVFLALIATCMAECRTRRVRDEFESFKRQYRKAYMSDEEEQMRCDIFAENLAKIETHNLRQSRDDSITWTLEINKFADYTPEEFIAKYGGLDPGLQSTEDRIAPKNVFIPDPNYKASASKDWRTSNKVSPVKNQAQCGSCWAFSAVAVVESHYAIKYNQILDISEQQLVECSSGPSTGQNAACNGGLQKFAFDYWNKTTGGVAQEKDYPYISGTGSNGTACHWQSSFQSVKISGYTELTKTDSALLQAVDTIGPIAVAVRAGVSQWQLYKTGSLCDKSIYIQNLSSQDHAVLLVGYTTTDWIVKNSWGDVWGQAGYIYLCRSITNNCGISGKGGLFGIGGVAPLYATVV